MEVVVVLTDFSRHSTQSNLISFPLFRNQLNDQLALAGESCLRRNATVVSCARWYSLVVFSDPSHGAWKPGFTPAHSKL
jgi:hypothetical protein